MSDIEKARVAGAVTPRELIARRDALIARSGLLRTALSLEVRLVDAQVSTQGARALRWWRLGQQATRVLRMTAWALPLLQAVRAGATPADGSKPMRRLLRSGLRLLPLALRALPWLLRSHASDRRP